MNWAQMEEISRIVESRWFRNLEDSLRLWLISHRYEATPFSPKEISQWCRNTRTTDVRCRCLDRPRRYPPTDVAVTRPWALLSLRRRGPYLRGGKHFEPARNGWYVRDPHEIWSTIDVYQTFPSDDSDGSFRTICPEITDILVYVTGRSIHYLRNNFLWNVHFLFTY